MENTETGKKQEKKICLVNAIILLITDNLPNRFGLQAKAEHCRMNSKHLAAV